ncbi:hypothetical protein AYJ70_26305 [Pseudomonas monteilii]|uniref:Uncharacterized protein n=1 Tax=Pseudomonas monteilii TaxID=76759 RepID=A0AAP7FK81_9PSED|nr:hypothetical protein HB4184_14240 [Pseudomonas putida]OAH47812.1 hypothetical protein AYJ70_26305 [Pseudomonas monteilii]
MPTGVTEINRITRTIGITVQTTRSKWAEAVRAMEAHQYRVITTIAITQQIKMTHQQVPIECRALSRNIIWAM